MKMKPNYLIFEPPIPKLGTGLTSVGGSVELYLCARYKISFCLYNQDSSIMCRVTGIHRVMGDGTYMWDVHGLLGPTFVCLTESAPDKVPDVCVVQEICLKVDFRHLCFSGRPKASQHLSEFDQRLSSEAQAATPMIKFLQSKQPIHYRCYHPHTCIRGLAEYRHFDFLMDDHEIDKLGGGKKIASLKAYGSSFYWNDSASFL